MGGGVEENEGKRRARHSPAAGIIGETQLKTDEARLKPNGDIKWKTPSPTFSHVCKHPPYNHFNHLLHIMLPPSVSLL